MRSLRQHPSGAQACWDWLQESWDLLYSIRKNGGINSFGFLPLTLSGLATKEHLKQVEDFFADKVEPVSDSFQTLNNEI
jgi:aminopeptidase 2